MSKIIIDSDKFWVPDTCLDCPFLSSFNEVMVNKDHYKKIAFCTLNPDIEDPWRKISWFANNKEEWCPIKEEKTDEEVEDPSITVCRDTAIEQNLPLYFIYDEETGIFKAYITETKELFEKRRCPKFLPAYKFKEIVDHYLLYWYPDWKEEHKNET